MEIRGKAFHLHCTDYHVIFIGKEGINFVAVVKFEEANVN